MNEEHALDLTEQQLRLKGALVLHSETAAKNGGDYDFDSVCVVEGDRFPLSSVTASFTRSSTRVKRTSPKACSPGGTFRRSQCKRVEIRSVQSRPEDLVPCRR